MLNISFYFVFHFWMARCRREGRGIKGNVSFSFDKVSKCRSDPTA